MRNSVTAGPDPRSLTSAVASRLAAGGVGSLNVRGRCNGKGAGLSDSGIKGTFFVFLSRRVSA